ncbi:T-complex protein 1 subunit theta [Linum grandiflorum]
MGLHPSEIISGYTKASDKVKMRAAVASKQFGQEDVLCSLIADACIQVCPKNPASFNVDNIRVAKLVGGGLRNSAIVRGMVLKSDAVGTMKKIEKAKVSIFFQFTLFPSYAVVLKCIFLNCERVPFPLFTSYVKRVILLFLLNELTFSLRDALKCECLCRLLYLSVVLILLQLKPKELS